MKYFIKINISSPFSEVVGRESIYDKKDKTGGHGEDTKIVSVCCRSCVAVLEENTGESFCCLFSPAVLPCWKRHEYAVCCGWVMAEYPESLGEPVKPCREVLCLLT